MCSVSGYRPLINPPPVPTKSTFRYNYVQFHSGVVFFFVIFSVRVSFRVRLWV